MSTSLTSAFITSINWVCNIEVDVIRKTQNLFRISKVNIEKTLSS